MRRRRRRRSGENGGKEPACSPGEESDQSSRRVDADAAPNARRVSEDAEPPIKDFEFLL